LSAIANGAMLTCADITYASLDGTNAYNPVAELITKDASTLVGTSVGGSSTLPYGNIFQVDISQDTPVVTNVIAFDATHGAAPRTRLLQGSDGTYYGTTSSGGGDYCTAGTVYRYGPSGPADAGSPCPSTGGGSMTPALLLLLSTLGLARRFTYSLPRTATRKRSASGRSLS